VEPGIGDGDGGNWICVMGTACVGVVDVAAVWTTMAAVDGAEDSAPKPGRPYR
jgi:hypothetical protein